MFKNSFKGLIIMVQTACGIKRLFCSIDRPPTKQSALLDNFKSEATSRLGYFFA